mmetsp:Transcript_40767/g.102626  ORF Transcript_40767/g.102626 Transcript_40767/m.102626 type:complete len:421 (+) Transcript_40767:354-1616(+)
MRKIQSSIDLVQNVHWRWLEKKQRQNEGESEKRSLTTGQFGECFLPDATKCNTHLQAIHHTLTLGWTQLGSGTRQKGREDLAKMFVDMLPSSGQSFFLLLIQLIDHIVDLLLVGFDFFDAFPQQLILLLCTLIHVLHLPIDGLRKQRFTFLEFLVLRTIILHVACSKVEISASLSKESRLCCNESVSLLQGIHRVARILMLLMKIGNLASLLIQFGLRLLTAPLKIIDLLLGTLRLLDSVTALLCGGRLCLLVQTLRLRGGRLDGFGLLLTLRHSLFGVADALGVALQIRTQLLVLHAQGFQCGGGLLPARGCNGDGFLQTGKLLLTRLLLILSTVRIGKQCIQPSDTFLNGRKAGGSLFDCGVQFKLLSLDAFYFSHKLLIGGISQTFLEQVQIALSIVGVLSELVGLCFTVASLGQCI